MKRQAVPEVAGPPRLTVRLFGHVELEIDGHPFHLVTPRKTLSLFTFLVLNRTAAVQREFLAFLLFPDDDETEARTKFRLNLSDLNKNLPSVSGGWIQSDSESVRWRRDCELELDVERFEMYASDCDRFEDAVALYRGHLAESIYDEWIGEPRERLRNTYLATLDAVTAKARRNRDFPRAIFSAQRILAIEPFREDIVRRLIAMRYESGDAAGAVAEYERFAAHLRAELGTRPMSETVALRESVARGHALAEERHDEPPAQTLASIAAQEVNALPFVGRERELAQLEAAWNSASRGRATLVLVDGEPGIGKSRLVRDFAQTIADRGGRILSGASAFPESMPYQPFVEALRGALPLVTSLSLDTVTRATLASLLPELAARDDAPMELPALNAGAERARTFEAVGRAFAGIAKPRPVQLVLDDLHGAGESTLAMLDFLLRRLATAPLLIVATVREGESTAARALARLRRDLGARSALAEVFLRSLSDGEATSLVAARISDPIVAHAIRERAEGHPLYLTQLIESAREGSFESAASLEMALAARTERLSPEARTIGAIAAMIGRRFPSSLLAAVAGWSEADARTALDELIGRRMVRETPGRGLLDSVFAHQLLADALFASAPPERNPARHRRIAVALEASLLDESGEFSSDVARHYDLAGDVASATPRYIGAGRRALRLGAVSEALALFERAASLAVDDPTRAEALLEAEYASRLDNDAVVHARVHDELETIRTRLDDALNYEVIDRHRLRALRDNDLPRAYRAFDDLRALALRLSPSHVARTDYNIIRSAQASEIDPTRFGIGPDLLEPARKLAARFADLGEVDYEARSLSLAASVAAKSLRVTAAYEFFAAAECAAAESTVETQVLVQSSGCALSAAVSDRELGVRCGERWFELARSIGDRIEAAKATMSSGWALMGSNRPADALAAVREAYEFFNVHGPPSQMISSGFNLGYILRDVGALDELLLLLAEIESDERAQAFQYAKVNRARLRSEALAHSDRADEAVIVARSGLREATGSAEARYFYSLGLRIVDAELMRGDAAAALREAEATLEFCRERDYHIGQARLLARVAEAQWVLGDLAQARKTVDELMAIANWDEREYPEQTRWIAAFVLHACGEDREARAMLQKTYACLTAALANLSEPYRTSYLTYRWRCDVIAAAEQNVWPTNKNDRL